MSSLKDCKLGTPIPLRSLALFYLIISMDALEETVSLCDVHFTKVFSFSSPFLEIFKTYLDKVLCSLLWVTLLRKGDWTR